MFQAGSTACRYHASRHSVNSSTTSMRLPIRSYRTAIVLRPRPVLQTSRNASSAITAASSTRALHTYRTLAQRFSPLVPPPPSSLPKAQAAKQYKRTRKWLRRIFYLSLFVGAAHLTDRYFLYSSLTRSARTFALGIIVAVDYKIKYVYKSSTSTSAIMLTLYKFPRTPSLRRLN